MLSFAADISIVNATITSLNGPWACLSCGFVDCEVPVHNNDCWSLNLQI